MQNLAKAIIVFGTILLMTYLIVYNKGVSDTSKGINQLIKQREMWHNTAIRFINLHKKLKQDYEELSIKYKHTLIR